MGQQTLHRQVFELRREIEFFSEKEVAMQIGHSKPCWYVCLIKELIDNALEACEIAGTKPEITATIEDDYFEVADNGPGLLYRTLQKSLNYLTRVSDKQFYVSPTRGQSSGFAT